MKNSVPGAIFLICCLFFPVQLSAEGTKQFRPLESHKGELCIDTTRNKFLSVIAPDEYKLYIHIKDFTTEAIYFGFGETKHNLGAATFRLYRPDGTIDTSGAVPTTTGERGYIDNWSQAVTGPSAVAGASGYWALRCTPDMNGDYYLAFKITWQTGWGAENYKTFANFDLTVVNTPSMTAIDGRLWSKAWQLYAETPTQGSANQYFGSFFVYTNDSIITKVDLNGMIPGTFTTSCNSSGCYPVGPLWPANLARKSVSGEHTYPEYRLFLNDPEVTSYPSGILGGLDNSVPITTQRNCDGTIEFTFGCNKGGNVEIHLLLSALGAPYVDRILPSPVVTGINTITWDGLDGNGLPVPNGATFQFFISYVNGLTHLPLYDVEFNANGFRLNLVRPISVPPPPDPLFYWDDSNLPGGTTNFAGCLSSPLVGCHIWNSGGGGGFGNNRTINTWWYAVSTSTASTQITEIRAPGTPGAILGPASVCGGATNIAYSVPLDPNSTSYQWTYSGTGVTITGNGNSVITIDFAVNATPGVLSVRGYNTECGLSSNPTTLNITIQPFPDVTLTPFGPTCLNTPAFPLTGGSPAGGFYTINGTPAVIFDPAAQGTGTFIISYSYTDPLTTCSKTVSQNLSVFANPVVSLQPFSPVCSYIAPFPLTGGSPAGGVYTGAGVSGGLFDPAAAGAGTWPITYTYTDVNGCSNATVQTITVFDAQQAVVTPFAPVCVTTPAFVLTGGTPAGGTWSGPGVTGSTFDPSATGPGTFNLTYLATDPNGCNSSDSEPITVNPLPGNAGTISGNSLLCQGSVNQDYAVPVIPNTTTYSWTLSPGMAGTINGTGNLISIDFAPAYSGTASLTVKGVNNCGDGLVSAPFVINVASNPPVSFSICTDSVTTFDARPFTLKGALPTGGTYTGPGVNSSTGVFTPSLAGTGVKTITYTYTNTWGCMAALSKTITVVSAPLFNCGMTYRDVRDNRDYQTIRIGGQCWMAENLNYGSQIVSSLHQRDNCTIEKYCYGDNPANCLSSGGLYQWDEVMGYAETPAGQGLCPPSWHLPTEAEWNTLFSNYINNGFAASALKFDGFSGFVALLSGTGHGNVSSDYNGFATFHWSSTPHGRGKAWAHGMNAPDPSVSRYPSNRNHAFSVRCVKD